MFKQVVDPQGFYAIYPLPTVFFEMGSPFGNGMMLVLNKYANNALTLAKGHLAGIATAAAQVNATAGHGEGTVEAYGITDRAGSDSYNQKLSAQRAKLVEQTMRAQLGLADFKASWSNGLGETFAAEYYSEQDSSRDANMRGVACYIFDSMSAATDPFLQLSIKFAAPPAGNDAMRRGLLGPLYLGRYRASPPSPFAR